MNMKAIPLLSTLHKWGLVAFAALALMACPSKGPDNPDEPDPGTEPEPELPTLSLDQTELHFSQAGEWKTVNVTSNTDWVAAAFGDGFTVSPASGSKNGTLTITAAPATSPEARTGSISVRAGASLAKTVDLTQSAKSVITVTSGPAEFGPEGGQLEVKVEYNVDYNVELEAGATWLTRVETKAMNTQTLVFDVAPNDTYDDRSAKITVKDKGGVVADQVVTVNQSRKNGLMINVHEVEAPHSGHSFDVEVQYSHEYSVKILDNWIQQVETKGLNTQRLSFTVADNVSSEARTGRVAFAASQGDLHDTLTVTQGAKYFEITVLDNVSGLSEQGATFSISVKHNVPYGYDINQSWCALKEQSTQGDTDHLTFAVSPNATYEPREGVITFKEDSGAFQDFTVAFSQIQEYVLSVTSQKYYEAPYDGMTLTVEVSYSTPYDVVIAETDYWIRQVETKALGQGSHSFAVAMTTSDMQREGHIIFRTRLGQAADTVTIVQAPGESQRLTLIALYRALGGANWTGGMNAGWDSLEPIGQWAGVTVENGRITGLELPNANLVGSLPAEVNQLQNLKVLDLSGNPKLTGDLPQGLGDFTLLQELRLNDCGLSGTLAALGTSAAATRPLRVVRLENNAFTGDLPRNLISALPKLDTLWLTGNGLSGNLPDLSQLQDTGLPRSFRLDQNAFTGSVPETWSEMPILSSSFDLRIQGNRLMGEIPYTLQKHANYGLWEVDTYFRPQQNNVSLTLQRVLPVVGEVNVRDILGTTAKVSAAVSDNGGDNPTAYGFEVNGKDVSATLQGQNFEAALTGLPVDSQVEVRAWAQNVAGKGYGPLATFQTAGLPTLSEVTVTDLGPEGATLNARVTDYGRDPRITASGFIIDNMTQNVSLSADGKLIFPLRDLLPGTTHSVQAFATNSAGRQVSAKVSFTTIGYPAVRTLAATDVEMNSVVIHGQVDNLAGGSIVERGFYFNGQKYVVPADRAQFSQEITGLSSDLTYYYYAYVINEAGSAEGDQLSVRTLQGADLNGVVSSGATYLTGAQITLEKMNGTVAASAPLPQTKAITHEARMEPLTPQALVQNYALIRRMLAQAAQAQQVAPASQGPQPMAMQAAAAPLTYSCTTESGGSYRLQDMEPGLYGVRISLNGYVTFHTQIQLTQGDNHMNFDGLKPTEGAQMVQWYKPNVALRPLAGLPTNDPVMATVTWAPADLSGMVGKAISKVVFYPTEASDFFVLMVNDESVVSKLTEMINKYQDKIEEISAGGELDPALLKELLPLVTTYGKYLMMIAPESVRPGCTNVVNYAPIVGGAEAKVDVKSGQIFSVIFAGVATGSTGPFMTDGAGPAVNNKGNVVMVGSNPNAANLSQLGYQGNWHIGMGLK